jgi:hypothetical protein
VDGLMDIMVGVLIGFKLFTVMVNEYNTLFLKIMGR